MLWPACARLLQVSLLPQAGSLILQGSQLVCRQLSPSLGVCSPALSRSGRRLGLLLRSSRGGGGGSCGSLRRLRVALPLLSSSLRVLGSLGLAANALIVHSSSVHSSLGGQEPIPLLLGLQPGGGQAVGRAGGNGGT